MNTIRGFSNNADNLDHRRFPTLHMQICIYSAVSYPYTSSRPFLHSTLSVRRPASYPELGLSRLVSSGSVVLA